MDTYPHKDRGPENDPPLTGSQCRTRVIVELQLDCLNGFESLSEILKSLPMSIEDKSATYFGKTRTYAHVSWSTLRSIVCL